MVVQRRQTISIPRTRKLCLNCEHFHQLCIPICGMQSWWKATERGICAYQQKEIDAFRRPCKEFEFVKPR